MIGVKSTALLFGEMTKLWLAMFYGTMIALLAVSGAWAEAGIGYWLGLLVVAGHLIWQIVTVDIDDPDNCLARFQSNRDTGLLIIAAILLGLI